MLPTGILSMWISNTATTAMMLPISEAVLQSLQETRQKQASKTRRSVETEQKTNDGQYYTEHREKHLDNTILTERHYDTRSVLFTETELDVESGTQTNKAFEAESDDEKLSVSVVLQR